MYASTTGRITGTLVMAILLLQGLHGCACEDEGAVSVGSTELRTTERLVDDWRFTFDDSLSDEDALAATAEDWETVSLPHTWNEEGSTFDPENPYDRGIGWYRREFPTPQGARVWLEFGAASLVADAWLNGEYLGQHRGAFTAFRFDITDRLAEGGPNVLLVKTNSREPGDSDDVTAIPPIAGDMIIYGGLYRYVSVVTTSEPAHFDLGDMGGPGVYAHTTSVGDDGAATVHVRARAANDGPGAGEYMVRISLLGEGGDVAGRSEAELAVEAGAQGEVELDVTVDDARRWNGVDDPFQYDLVAELVQLDGRIIDEVRQRFGIREFRFDPDQGFFLNGEHVRLSGAAMHQDYQGEGWALSDEQMEGSLSFFEEIGANTIRLGHYPFGQFALDRVSEMGLVAWAEIPFIYGASLEPCPTEAAPESFVESARQQLQEMIRQQYNQASVAMWSVGNEVTAQHGLLATCEGEPFDNVTPLLQELHQLAKDEDPSRVTTLAEFAERAEGAEPFSVGGITDIWATNRYFGWYDLQLGAMGPLLDSMHERYPDQPLGVAEYGAGAVIDHHTDNPHGGPPEVFNTGQEVVFQPEEYASFVHEENWRVLSSKDYLWGTYVWNMFDFGSPLRLEGEVEGVNTKGLVTFDRQVRKDPFYFYKANWSAAPLTWITSKRYTDRAYALTDVKVYSNADPVRLLLNGEEVGSMGGDQCEQRTCVFENVRLALGENTLEAEGTHDGETSRDSVEWMLESEDINIMAGQLTTGGRSGAGDLFGSDNFFSGGTGNFLVPREIGEPTVDRTPVGGTEDPDLYRNYRSGDFSYEIPVDAGSYEVTLGFLEPTADTAPGGRVFDVTAEGETVVSGLDVLAEAGAYRTVIVRTFEVEVTDGSLSLDFNPINGDAVVSTIAVRSPE